MLRISVTDNALERRWILQGRLTEDAVAELDANWRASRDRQAARKCIVDLNEVTSIDQSGEQVLLMMIRDGVEFVATGLYTRHLLDALRARSADLRNSD